MNRYMLIGVCLATLYAASPAWAKVVHYELVTRQEPVNLSGKKTVDFALTVNGGIPGPTLEFTEGDDAEIVVKNEVPNQETSIHWHGILLPPEMDGVAYVNTPPIRTGESFTFRFKVRQNGTYWYHSHTDVQEQKGVYGSIVIHPRKPKIKVDKDVVVMLSDWSDENATNILKNLRKDGDYYLYKKGTIRSLYGAWQAHALGTYLDNEWTRMGGMDLSDVGYDAFLMNGKRDVQLTDAKPGETVRLRVINGAGSSYFHVALGDKPLTVIAADGQDVEPIQANNILIGMAETYDILFKVPDAKNYELRVTAQDGTGSASGWIGSGEKVAAPVRPKPDMYAGMDHAAMGHTGVDHSKMNHAGMDHSKMNHNAPTNQMLETLTVDQLKAPEKTTPPASAPVYDVKLVLGGDMSRYIWYVNGKTIQEDRNIMVKEGDVVRFTFVNETMMHHPMHLHGHFFRVMNGQGDYSPLKHTVDVPPHGIRTIEFYANEPGEWMLHCHNLYHMKTGMARVVKYMSYQPAPEIAAIQKYDHHNHDHWYTYGTLTAMTNLVEGSLRFSQTWNEIDARVETTRVDKKTWESAGDLFYRRWRDQYLNWIAGVSVFDKTTRGVAGIGYLLPMLIESNLLVDHKGKLRLDLEKEFQWTTYWQSGAHVSLRTDYKPEWSLSLMYAPTWSWAAGFNFTEENIGVGARVQF